MGIKLNLTRELCHEINNRNCETYQKVFEILTSWREKAGQKANVNHIIKILIEMDKNNIAEVITKLNPIQYL